MPIFAYQSFNANASSVHDLDSLNARRFTVMTHGHLAPQGIKKACQNFSVFSCNNANVHQLGSGEDGMRSDTALMSLFSFMCRMRSRQERKNCLAAGWLMSCGGRK